MTCSVIIDLLALETLEFFPERADRVVLTTQVSPMRRHALETRFPGAEFVEAWGDAAVPWENEVEQALDELRAVDSKIENVPLLDCFRETFRHELENAIRLKWAIGDGGAIVVEGGKAEKILMEWDESTTGPLVERVNGVAASQRSLISRFQAAGKRGLAMALASRLDPTGLRRSHIWFGPTLKPCGAMLVSSYVNTTRAALELADILGVTDFTLVTTVPFATEYTPCRRRGHLIPLHRLLGLNRPIVKTAVRHAITEVPDRLKAWGGGKWWPLIRGTNFGRILHEVLAPELAAAVAGLRLAIEATGAQAILTGNEFASSDRAAIHLARNLGLRSAVRQHGVLDYHYRHDPVLADEFWLWDEPTREIFSRMRPESASRFRVAPRTNYASNQSLKRRDAIVLFSQPYELIPLSGKDLLNEVLPSFLEAARRLNLEAVIKLHPMETVSGRAGILRPYLSVLEIQKEIPVSDLLSRTAVAVVLDSSVVVDCRDACVPVVGIGWYPGIYVHELEQLGYVRLASSPQAMVEEIVGISRRSLHHQAPSY